MIALFRYLRTIHPISNELRDYMEETLKEKHLAKKDFLLKAGQVCSNIYFVERGILRSYYFKGDKEITSVITKENEICVSATSFFSLQYGAENIQAIEDCTLYFLTHEDYQRLNTQFPEFNALCRILLEKCYSAREQRLMEFWMQPSHDRYYWLFHQSPELFQRVPAKYIASYLGITETMLSKIKSDIVNASRNKKGGIGP